MTRSLRSLPKLTTLCQAMRDAALADLSKATRQREETLRHLDRLSQPHPATDLGIVQAAQAAYLYQTWANSRRASLNVILAEQTVAVAQATAAASLALGRVESLSAITERQEKRARRPG